MAGIVAAGGTDDHIGAGSKDIDNLSLALVSPLGADQLL